MEGTELENKMESEKGFNSKTVTIMVITAIIIGAAALSLGIVGTVHNDVNKVSGSTNITITGSQNDPTVNLKTALTEITSIDSLTAGLSLSASTDSKFEVTGSGQDLTLEVSGGGTQKLSLNSAGTGAGAIDINATGGGIDIDASSAVSIESTTGSITMGNALADEQTLTLGNTSSIAMILIPSATPADEKIVLANYNGTAFNSISIFSNNGGIDISGSTGISMNSLSGAINIGNDADAQNINIGTGAAARTITVGNAASTKVDVNALIIELDSAGTIITNSVTTTEFTSGTTMTLSSSGILAIDTSGTAAINFGTEAVAKTITIGNDASAKVDVNALIIELDSAGTIITNSVTTTEFTSGTTMTLSSGDILAIDTSGTAAINFGTEAAAKTITIGNDASAKVDVNALIIELDSAGTIITNSVTTTEFTSGTTMTLSSSGILAIDTSGTAAINFGTEAAAKTITIGNDASAKVDVNALIIELDSAGTIITNSVTTTEFTSGTTMTLSSSGILAIDTDGTSAINFGTEAVAKTITIGNAASAKVDVNALIIELDSGTTGLLKLSPGTAGLITNRAVATITDSATDATAAQYVGGFISCTGGGNDTWTLPTGAALADVMPSATVVAGDSFICYVSNASGGTITYAAGGSGSTISSSGAGTLVQKDTSLAKLEFIFTVATGGSEEYTCLLIADNS